MRVGDQEGYIDRSGRVVIPPKYGLAWGFTEGLASVSLISRPGHIGEAGFIWNGRGLGPGLHVHRYLRESCLERESKSQAR